MMKPFWVVWRGGSLPIGWDSISTIVHKTRSEADKEAERLAAANPGIEFYVLKGLAKVVSVACPFTWDKIDQKD